MLYSVVLIQIDYRLQTDRNCHKELRNPKGILSLDEMLNGCKSLQIAFPERLMTALLTAVSLFGFYGWYKLNNMQ